MSLRLCRLPLRWLLPALLLAATAHAAPPGTARQREAERLVQRALVHLAHNTIETRRMAMDELERATLLEPRRADAQLLLARAEFVAGFLREAMQRFEKVVELAPRDPEGHIGLGLGYRRDWLKYLDSTSLAHSADEFASAAQIDSTRADAWLQLSALRVELHDTTAALAAAERAAAAAPGRPEPLLALASTRWRAGDVEGADSAFRVAFPQLPDNVRERFDDIAPLASEQDTALYNHLPLAGRAEFARRFWKEHDPDLASPENEAQLEYWARVAQAYFLFYDTRHEHWDERGELYVRYGPPQRAEYNPLGVSLYTKVSAADGMMYPMNVLAWSYPQLGMNVVLQDRVLSEHYQLPATTDHDPDPRPDPAALAKLDAIGTHDLRGVFPARPPRTHGVPLQTEIARFDARQGARLWIALGVAAAPDDSLEAQLVVLDSTRQEVRHARRGLTPSACEAARVRVADFGDELPPGDYLVGLSVHAGDRRGSVRVPVHVPPPDSTLSLSDLVITCGMPAVASNPVRLDANPAARVADGALLTAYFEIDHLSPGPGGRTRFEMIYTVRSAGGDGRIWLQRLLSPRAAGPSIEASRIEESVGELRRQFVSVPVQSLPPGEYRLEIHVRDLVSGDEATRAAHFTRVAGS